MAKTSFFKSCFGVFQGGGCRAAAFVGAYEEAVRSGVSFTEVAGTSAGSIVASLVGAGAAPNDLRNILADVDFRAFAADPERRGRRGLFGRLLGTRFPRWADLAFDQGFHSPLPIKQWIDEQLATLLPAEPRPISFASLPFPTYLVSTDLSRAEAKVWSQKHTPHELVGDAVLASCAIPVFFQPVDRRHVDGGVLSNLPAFVFFDEYPDQFSSERVLAFTLTADETDPGEWNTETFLRLLVNAVVDGSQKLQLRLQRNVHVITIPTGQIRATDFDKMTPDAVNILIGSGINATRAFFDQELIRVQSSGSSESVCFGTDEMYARTTENLDVSLDRIVIADFDSDWVYSLFPSILCWRYRGVRVEVLLPELGDKADGPYRRKLLRAMGVHLTELPKVTSVPMRAFITIPRDAAQQRAVVGVEKRSKSQIIDAVMYEGFLDAIAMRAVLAQLEELISPYPEPPPAIPVFGPDAQDALLLRIRSVWQYSKDGVDVGIEDVPLDRILSLTRFVREYKFRQIRHLIEMYKHAGLALFEPAAVLLNTGERSIVTPPVVEASGDHFVLVEGSTRITYCRDEGESKIKCIVVRNVSDPLPSSPLQLRQVRVIGRTLDARQRYEKFNYSHFRSIERAVHPLDSLR